MNSNAAKIMIKIMSNNQLTLDEVSDCFNVSIRMVRNNLHTINDYLNAFESSIDICKDGILDFKGDEEVVLESLKRLSYKEYSPSQEERLLVIFYLLILSPEYITLNSIIDFMVISRSTAISDMSKIKNWIKNTGLEIEGRTNFGYRLYGDENKLRDFMVEQISDYSIETSRFVNTYFSEKKEDQILLIEIDKDISNFENKEKRYLSVESIDLVRFYILFTKNRIENNYKLGSELSLLKTNYTDFELNSTEFNESEKQYLVKVLESLNYLTRKTKESSIIQTQVITRQFIESLSQDLKIDLNKNYSFYENLSAHLSSIIDETGPAIIEVPEVLDAIKGHKLLIEIVTKNVHIIEVSARRTLNNMEIAYIVIYVSLALEELKSKISLNVLVVCDSGVATSQLLKTKIKLQFNFPKIDVASSRTVEKIRGATEYDIVFSTIKVSKGKERIIDVSKYFQTLDMSHIIEVVDEVKIEKLISEQIKKVEEKLTEDSKNVLKEVDEETDSFDKFLDNLELKDFPKLSELVTEEYIEIGANVLDWKEAIRASAKPLLSKSIIDESYIDNMIAQVYDNGPYFVIGEGIAFPHGSYESGTNDLGISLTVLKNPVPFGVECFDPVKLVCTLSPIDNKTHLRAFFTLVNLLHNEVYKQGIIKAKTKSDIIKIIKEYEEKL